MATRLSVSSPQNNAVGCVGRVIAGVVGLAFLAVGLGIAWTGVRSGIDDYRERSWPVIPCTITHSDVTDVGRSESKYRWDVTYHYIYNGAEHTSSIYSRDYAGASDYSAAQQLKLEHSVGSRAECYVDPQHPEHSVLRHRGQGHLLLVPFGLVLGAFGLLPLWAARRASPTVSAVTRSQGPISSKANRAAGGMIFLFGVFALVGGVLLWFMFLHPLLRSYQALSSWRQVPCTILSSRVTSHRGDKSTTYSVDILYRYGVDGREYRSNRYNFSQASSGGQSAKAAIVRQFPRGRATDCYVDPGNPAEAVLRPQDRSYLAWAWLPAIFLLIGVLGMAAQMRRVLNPVAMGRSSRGRFNASSGTSRRDAHTPDPDRALTLRPRAGAAAKLIGIGIFAVFWNGIVSVFVFQAWQEWQHGSGRFLTFFLVPFVLVGLGFIVALFYFLLALLNPRLTLTLGRGVIPAGDAVDLEWGFGGRHDRIQRLTIRLEGREEATYRRGTHTTTDTRVFAALDLIETAGEMEIRFGRRKLQIPANAAPTFHAKNNNIRWVLKVRGEIRHWPDVNEEFEIEVLPPRYAQPAPLAPGVSSSGDTGDARLWIELEGGRTAFAPGDSVRGTASWDLDGAPRSLELRLFWYTRGKGTTDVQIVSAVPIDSPQQRGNRAFEFKLPDQPLSFSGQLVSVIWAIELVASPGNKSQRVEIVVGPGGQELRLDAPQPSEARS